MLYVVSFIIALFLASIFGEILGNPYRRDDPQMKRKETIIFIACFILALVYLEAVACIMDSCLP